jgi:hypothetical protein
MPYIGCAQPNKEGQMPRPKRVPADGLSKFQRYRRDQRSKGLRLLRVWVPDPSRPEFALEARRQGTLLSGRPEEKEAMVFIEAAFNWPDP